jgi:hypothetical protein
MLKYVLDKTVQLINKAIMDPSTQQFFFFSSDVIVTTCFDHTTIIKRHTVVYCRTVATIRDYLYS